MNGGDNRRERAARSTAGFLFAAGIAACVLAFAGALSAQDPGAAWEAAAGGKMAFEVSSVKLNPSPYNFSFNIAQEPDDGEDFTPSGGLFDAKDWPLWMYIAFAYKLPYDQLQPLKSQVPKWVIEDSFDIQGRAAGNPSKDQYRLMVQALLADRFKMAAAWETREGPVDALELAKPGKTGPQLRPFPDGFSCATSLPKAGRGPANSSEDPATSSNAAVPGEFPAYCGLLDGFAFVPMASSTGGTRYGARDVSWGQIERKLALMGGQFRAFDRSVVDKTGVSGTYDVALDLAPTPGDRDARAEVFLDALKDQLGIKVDPTTGPMPVLVIRHIEQPSAN